MNSRMEKYNVNTTDFNRSQRNKELYREASKVDLSQLRTYSNSKVIDRANKEIDIDKIRRYIEKLNSDDSVKERKKINEIEYAEEEGTIKEEEKDYDINSVLEKARSKREFDYDEVRSKKPNTSSYEILQSIIKNNKEQTEEEKETYNTGEQTLINLINTISVNKKEADLFEDLKGSDNTELLTKIEDVDSDESFKEKIKSQIDSNTFEYHTNTNDLNKTMDDVKEELQKTKEMTNDVEYKTNEFGSTESFYTTKNSFTKKDFGEEKEDGGIYEEKSKNSVGKFLFITLIILIIIGILIVISNYVFDLGLF